MIIKFLIYGIIGWCMEIVWTGLGSLVRKNFKLTANTSLWMFLIYGLAGFLTPVCDIINGLPVLYRGGVYVICFFGIEYATGFLLKKLNACPWDYSASKFNINGIIRLDYAPVWFIAGLIFEAAYMYIKF